MLLPALIIAAVLSPVLAQARVENLGPYVVRGNVVSTLSIPGEVATRHGIERDPDRAILDVVVHEQGAIERTRLLQMFPRTSAT